MIGEWVEVPNYTPAVICNLVYQLRSLRAPVSLHMSYINLVKGEIVIAGVGNAEASSKD